MTSNDYARDDDDDDEMEREEENDAEEMMMIRCRFRRYAVERSANNRCAITVDLM